MTAGDNSENNPHNRKQQKKKQSENPEKASGKETSRCNGSIGDIRTPDGRMNGWQMTTAPTTTTTTATTATRHMFTRAHVYPFRNQIRSFH